jgi:hypothetical protein
MSNNELGNVREDRPALMVSSWIYYVRLQENTPAVDGLWLLVMCAGTRKNKMTENNSRGSIEEQSPIDG